MTMAEQTPARKAVQSIISTLVANTVNIQEAEKGRLTTNKEFLLPHLNTTEEGLEVDEDGREEEDTWA